MTEVGTAWVTILPSSRNFGRNLQGQIGGQVATAGAVGGKTYGRSFGKTAGTALKGAGTAGLIAVALSGITSASQAAKEAARIAATTTATIKSTGGVAKVSAEHVGDLTDAIRRKTAVDDDSVRVGANQLLTFSAVRNEVGKGNAIFDRATQAAVDLSAHGFGSIESAAVQLGKALQDPVKGMTALSRSGITFTAQQKEQIKTLVASGDTLKAQSIILAEVERQVGGTAAAQATNVDKLTSSLNELKESAGGELNTRLNTAAGRLLALGAVADAANAQVAKHPGTLGRVKTAAGEASQAFNPLLGVLGILGVDTEKVSSIVSTAFSRMQDRILSAMGSSKSEVRSLVSTMRSELSSLGPIGSNAGEAFSSAIIGKLESLLAKVRPKIIELQEEFKKALGINSPSKVFMSLGASTGEGFLIGMERSFGEVRASAGSLALAPASAVRDVAKSSTPTARGRYALTITNWHDGTGYITEVADANLSRRVFEAATV